MANNDVSVMDKDLANKNMEDMMISNNYPKGIIKDYLEVSLYSMIKVLEVIDDDEVKFEVTKCGNELQVNFIGIKNITLNIIFSFVCTHHKLNLQVYM